MSARVTASSLGGVSKKSQKLFGSRWPPLTWLGPSSCASVQPSPSLSSQTIWAPLSVGCTRLPVPSSTWVPSSSGSSGFDTRARSALPSAWHVISNSTTAPVKGLTFGGMEAQPYSTESSPSLSASWATVRTEMHVCGHRFSSETTADGWYSSNASGQRSLAWYD